MIWKQKRSQIQIMQFGAQVAGLDQCDLRVAYGNFMTSTPTKMNICGNSNMECWDDYNASRIPTYAPCDYSEPNSDNDIDMSYGGHWSKFPNDSLALALGNLTDHAGHGKDSERIRPLGDSEQSHLPDNGSTFTSNTDIRANLNRKIQVQHKFTMTPPPPDNEAMRALNDVEGNTTTEEGDDVLNKRVCHIKSKADLKSKDNQTDPKLIFRKVKLRILSNNIRGWFGKKESLEAILASESIDIVTLCETFTTGSRYPEVRGFTTYYRNRPKRAMGGIAILVREEKAKYAVKVEQGRDNNEYLALKFTNCDPNLVIFVYYGAQSNTFGVDAKKLHLSELLDDVKKYAKKGCDVKLLGDFNLHLGNKVIKKNHPEASVTGRLFLDMIENMGLTIMNGLSPVPITYIDRSGPDHRENVLDLVISNKPENISDFKTDGKDLEFTPYSIKMKAGKSERTYADHMSIIFNFETSWQDRVVIRKEPIWNYKKPLGNVKYDLFTSNASRFLINKVMNEGDINLVHKAFCNTIKKAKFQSFNKRTLTASKIKRINDRLVWRQRISDLEALERQFKEEKESNKIYKARRVILKGPEDKQNYKAKNEETGEVLEDLDEILDYVLEFNVKNMEKVPPSEEVATIMRKKAKIIDELLSDHNVENFPDEIPWEVFLTVMEKVMRQRKACFRDLIKSGRGYKFAVFMYINRMFREEEFPEDSAITYLTRIWKGKGSRENLANNRFIHNKEPHTKLFEKCVVELVARKINQATPQAQAGSRKGRSTRDQMLKLLILQKFHESKGKPLPILLVDVRACFDKIRLSDVIFDTLEAGADAKAIRVLNKMASETVIKLKGDHRNEGEGVGRMVKNTLGQGTNLAPGGIGLTSSKTVDQTFDGDTKRKMLASVGDAGSDPQSYVDDISTFPKNEPSLRGVTVLIGDALERISLQSHPTKTEVIISGRNKKAVKMSERLQKKPALMQGNPVKVSESGTYLGMLVSNLGYKDSIDKTARHRVAKAWGRVADIKAVINDTRMRRTGWLRAGITLLRAIIIPSITYSADVWLGANKATEKYVRDEYKSMIYIALDIPTNTKFTSVLADLGLPNITAVMDKLRVNYVNHTLWLKGDTKLKEMLFEERRLTPNNNLLEIADRICEKYKIPPVSENQLDRGMVKRRIKLCDEIENWMSNLTSTATQNVSMERVRPSTNFYVLSKRESQSLIAYNAGAFKLKTAWGDYHQDQGCLAPMCGGPDQLDHIKLCPFYKTKWKEEYNKDSKLIAKYFVALDKERRRTWRGECLF